VLAVGTLAAVAAGAACVDLFHGTDFPTYCTDPAHTPDPACGGDGGDGAAPLDAGPPRVDFCSLSAAGARTYAEHACAWLGACEGPMDSTKISTCLPLAILAYDCRANPTLRPQGATLALWQCLAHAESCAAVDTCVYPAGVQTCAPTSGGGFTACGQGTNAAVRVQCTTDTGGRPSAVEPCLLTGRMCTTRTTSSAECTGAAGKNCSGAPTCQGTAAVACGTGGDSTIDRGQDCAYYGAGACIVLPDGGGVACVPADAGACPGYGPPSCAPNGVASRCVGGQINGQSVTIGCAALDAVCSVDAGTALAPQEACVPATATVSCTGDDTCSDFVATSCNAGLAYTLDCSAHGLGTCRIAPSGLAQCAPP
jgi:hypothetical protein